jgi:hypothetical protein
MMVNDRCRSMADRVDACHDGAEIAVFRRQRTIELPPQMFQDLIEIRGWGRLRKASRKRAIEMHMGVDESRHRDEPMSIDHPRCASRDRSAWCDRGNASVLDKQ